MMKPLILSLVLVPLAFAAAAQSASGCYADYKAKKDDPLRLQYGVAKIDGECAPGPAADELTPRLAADGWQLLEVLGTFDESGLEERRDSAGQFYLRY
jgi:hypothetical protein